MKRSQLFIRHVSLIWNINKEAQGIFTQSLIWYFKLLPFMEILESWKDCLPNAKLNLFLHGADLLNSVIARASRTFAFMA